MRLKKKQRLKQSQLLKMRWLNKQGIANPADVSKLENKVGAEITELANELEDAYLDYVQKGDTDAKKKLAEKVRYGSKKHRKYEPAKTPFKRLIESDQVDEKTKAQLKSLYKTLNPAALKRRIDSKLYQLLQVYQNKNKPIRQKRTKRKEVSSVRS